MQHFRIIFASGITAFFIDKKSDVVSLKYAQNIEL